VTLLVVGTIRPRALLARGPDEGMLKTADGSHIHQPPRPTITRFSRQREDNTGLLGPAGRSGSDSMAHTRRSARYRRRRCPRWLIAARPSKVLGGPSTARRIGPSAAAPRRAEVAEPTAAGDEVAARTVAGHRHRDGAVGLADRRPVRRETSRRPFSALSTTSEV
jgi:hypothetical protein